MFETDFTRLLVKERKARNLKKGEVAELFGWCSDYYCKIEKGYINPPKSRIKDFAEYLNISIEELAEIIEKSNADTTFSQTR